MILKIECDVDSTVPLENDITIQCKDKTVILKPKNKILSSIQITKKVSTAQKCKTQIVKINGRDTLNIDIDEQLFDELIKDFRDLESILPLDHGLKRIYWQNGMKRPRIDFEPENEEEKKDIEVWGISSSSSYPVIENSINPKYIQYLFENKHELKDLIIPLAFYREGISEFRDFRYIYAFNNFYYIIEDIYAKGEFKEPRFIDNCIKSPEFISCVEYAYNSDNNHKIKIKALLAERQLSETSKDLLKLIFRVRGSLHHYGSKNNQKQITPFNHLDYEPMAFLLMSIVLQALLIEIGKALKDNPENGHWFDISGQSFDSFKPIEPQAGTK